MSTSTSKFTYVSALTNAIDCGALDEQTIEKLSALRATLEKRAATAKTAEHKPTPKQRDNADTKERIVEYFRVNDPMQAKAVGAAFSITSQKAAALCNQLVAEGRLAKTIEKRVTYFGRVAE